MSWSTNPLYAILHESIYCQGQKSGWAAHAVRETTYREAFDAVLKAKQGQPVLFTGKSEKELGAHSGLAREIQPRGCSQGCLCWWVGGGGFRNGDVKPEATPSFGACNISIAERIVFPRCITPFAVHLQRCRSHHCLLLQERWCSPGCLMTLWSYSR